MRGKDPPTKLTPQMIPPSCRNQMPQQQQTTPIVSKVNPLVPAPVAAAAGPIKPGDYSAIKELDTLHGEVEQLGKEKLQLKQELVEKQDAIQQKKSEIDVSVFSYKKRILITAHDYASCRLQSFIPLAQAYVNQCIILVT